MRLGGGKGCEADFGGGCLGWDVVGVLGSGEVVCVVRWDDEGVGE